MEENVYYDKNYIKVTNNRFIVKDSTYVLANITKIERKSYFSGMTYLAFILGIVGVIYMSISLVIGFSIIFLSILIYKIAKKIYQVNLVTSSGAIMAYSSKNKQSVDEILEALNDAVAFKR